MSRPSQSRLCWWSAGFCSLAALLVLLRRLMVPARYSRPSVLPFRPNEPQYVRQTMRARNAASSLRLAPSKPPTRTTDSRPTMAGASLVGCGLFAEQALPGDRSDRPSPCSLASHADRTKPRTPQARHRDSANGSRSGVTEAVPMGGCSTHSTGEPASDSSNAASTTPHHAGVRGIQYPRQGACSRGDSHILWGGREWETSGIGWPE